MFYLGFSVSNIYKNWKRYIHNYNIEMGLYLGPRAFKAQYDFFDKTMIKSKLQEFQQKWAEYDLNNDYTLNVSECKNFLQHFLTKQNHNYKLNEKDFEICMADKKSMVVPNNIPKFKQSDFINKAMEK